MINEPERQFIDFGVPDKPVTDNGPQFDSREFRLFTKRLSIEHATSSPNYPRSKGQAECYVQTIHNSLSKMLADGKTLAETLVTIRSAPVGDGLPSPAVLLQVETYLLVCTAMQNH